ncbi:MAG: O-antigen ligase family protein, partial [Lachnospiraceae bacterium]|nr:O-antigen ligase family protein [Lachnospiraceae bacterium]
MMESMKEKASPDSIGKSGDIWKALPVAMNILILLALNIFFFSPLIQLVVRFVGRSKISRHQYPDLMRYESAIDTTNRIVIFAAIILYIGIACCAVYRHLNRRYEPAGSRVLSKDMIRRLLPFFFFVLFATGILVGTVIRGTNDWDMTGHWYMHESIFSFITYPLAYFFCGMLVFSEKARNILLYLLIGSALPLHILALVNEWGTHIVYFEAQGLSTGGVTTVFFNSNHYGYYLVITLLTSALLFVYEKRKVLRMVSAISGITATMVLIINNTLGAYLAVLFVLILFLIYCMVMDRQNRVNAVIILAVFLLITVIMSFRYDTIVSSLLVLSDDIGEIVENPLEADSAGSSRWRLWKGTVQHLPEHPLLGFGVEGLLSLYQIGTPHNEFLQYAAFFGLPVMVLYIAACAVVLWRVFRSSKDMSPGTMICFFVSIGYLASSFFG